jgi:hypothetical protein
VIGAAASGAQTVSLRRYQSLRYSPAARQGSRVAQDDGTPRGRSVHARTTAVKHGSEAAQRSCAGRKGPDWLA